MPKCDGLRGWLLCSRAWMRGARRPLRNRAVATGRRRLLREAAEGLDPRRRCLVPHLRMLVRLRRWRGPRLRGQAAWGNPAGVRAANPPTHAQRVRRRLDRVPLPRVFRDRRPGVVSVPSTVRLRRHRRGSLPRPILVSRWFGFRSPWREMSQGSRIASVHSHRAMLVRLIVIVHATPYRGRGMIIAPTSVATTRRG